MADDSAARGFWKRQWPFAVGGLVVGLGEVIYFLKFGTFIPGNHGAGEDVRDG